VKRPLNQRKTYQNNYIIITPCQPYYLPWLALQLSFESSIAFCKHSLDIPKQVMQQMLYGAHFYTIRSIRKLIATT